MYEFLLRNVEVTIRDDVKVKEYSNFYNSGNVFASHILKAIGIYFRETGDIAGLDAKRGIGMSWNEKTKVVNDTLKD